MIERVIGALINLGFDLNDTEIADILWLAVQMRRLPSSSPSQPNQQTQALTSGTDETSSQLPLNQNKNSQELSTTSERNANLYPQSSQDSTLTANNLTIKVPAARALQKQLAIARSLRPLKRRVPSKNKFVFDEAATVHRIAEEKLWIPVMRPASERWLELALIIDEGTSMIFWKQTIKELKRLLETHGAFRDVRAWGLFASENGRVYLRPKVGSLSSKKRLHNPKELIDPNGQRLFLIISDCVSPVWRNGNIYKTLAVWARSSSLAIVQVLPEWLWERSKLSLFESILLRSLAPGVPNKQLIMTVLDFLDESDVTKKLKVPVFTLEPESLKNWARMIAGATDVQTKGYLLPVDGESFDFSNELTQNSSVQLSAEQQLQRFILATSPMGRKLAGLLAAAPVSLPVVRLIQQTMLRESSQVHVAEVFLGGILKPLLPIKEDTEADNILFDFVDGVRDLLIEAVPSTETTEVLNKVSDYIAQRLGLSVNDFTANLVNPGSAVKGSSSDLVRPFAQIAAKVLKQLGGEYAEFAEQIEKNFGEEIQAIQNNNIKNITTTATEFFVGRKSEIITSFKQISNRGHLAIWGGLGIGKTTFLQLLASPITWKEHGLEASQAIIALISCKSINPFTPSSFWREILTLLYDDASEALQSDIQQILDEQTVEKGDLRRILRKIGQQNKFLLLLLDDYDVALRTNEQYTEVEMLTFLSEFRDLAVHSNEGRYLSTVVTTFRRLNELGPAITPGGSPWYNHYLFRLLQPLNDREIEELLGVIPIIPGLREAIKEIAGGNPRLLQIASSLLHTQLETDRKANKVPDIQEFINKFETETRHFFQNYWNVFSEMEQTLLMLLALFDLKGRPHNKNFDLGDIDLIFSQREREFTNLEEQGVIIHNVKEGKIVYSFASLMMQRWVIQEVWNTNNALIKERENVFLGLISRKQLGQIKSIWQHKDQILSTIEWFGNLVAAFPKKV